MINMIRAYPCIILKSPILHIQPHPTVAPSSVLGDEQLHQGLGGDHVESQVLLRDHVDA